MAKKLLEEGAVRSFMKLANLEPLAEEFVKENFEDLNEEEEEVVEEGEDDTLAEDNYDKSGPGPERPGAGKDGEHQGIAKNRGQEPPNSPDGKLQIPGTSYAGDHKMKDQSVTKKSIDSGTPLAENMGEEPEMEDEPEMGDEMAPPEPEMGDEMGGAGNEELLKKVVNAVADALGVDVSIDGEGEGEMEMEPELEEPGEELPEPEGGLGGEDEMMENDLSGIATEALMSELEKRGAVTLEEEDTVEEGGMYKRDDKDEEMMQEAIEAISKRVASKLLKK